MVTLISHSPAETIAIGEAWGRAMESGQVMGLLGDLGAGKTQLVKGIALGLGVAARVHSPTFALINQYSGGRWPLYHLDLYRLETPEQIVQAGLEEYLLNPNGVTVVEWADRWFDQAQGSIFKVQSSTAEVQCRVPPMTFHTLPVTSHSSPFTPYQSLHLCMVRIEIIGANERRICHEDFGD